MKLVMQTKQWSCVHACIATLKDIPEQEVIDKFPRAANNLMVRIMLAHYQIPVLDVNPALFLYIPGTFLLGIDVGDDTRHAVLVDIRKGEGIDVYDPLAGEQLNLQTAPALGNISEALWIIPHQVT